MGVSLVLLLILVVASVCLWSGFGGKSHSKSAVYEGKNARVLSPVSAPTSLVKYLRDDDGCGTTNKAVYVVGRVVDDFARVQYGCDGSKDFAFTPMDLRKTSSGWRMISPTNNFVNGIPLCDYLTKNKIPSSLEAFCVNGDNPTNNKPPYKFDLRLNPVQ